LAELMLHSSMRKYVLPISKNTHINFKGRDDFEDTDVDLRMILKSIGDRGSTVVKVPCYKSEDRWFVDFSLT